MKLKGRNSVLLHSLVCSACSLDTGFTGHQQMSFLAMAKKATDAVTGLFNRLCFSTSAEQR